MTVSNYNLQILYGGHKGVYGSLVERDSENETGIIRDADSHELFSDKELLRYRFIFNHFLSLGEQDIIGKTDVELFSGAGVKEPQDFKREPVFSKRGETIGINYMGMEVTDQVRNREKMAKLREEMVVQKAKETELNKTIHITGLTCSSLMVIYMYID
ncbi:histidine kinase 5 [Phtheirospermum japonicum]|uniref:Histidine kinase 5 n=1 Tax=Phtheirospermum japonicum TaxID=374723 RepID=A0A830CSG4_9LAMI|nr:histidine kinase 5 [Phtheirospermum japonicum]